jgi:phosphonate transport system substrate-binding protein
MSKLQYIPAWLLRGLRTWFAVAVLGFGSAGWAADTNSASPAAPAPLRLAFSAGVLGDLNRNDAKASIIAWGKALLAQRTVSVEGVEPSVFDQTEDLFRAMQSGQNDCAAVMTDEFLARPAALESEAVYLSSKNGKTTEQYVLLVHQGSGISDLAGLKGRNLELHKSPRTSLAAAWLDTYLADHRLGPAETVFRKIVPAEKVSRIVLRVFFRQTDACVVTRDAFETMGELNPQLRKELRVLATSPEVVPSVFFFRPEFTGRVRQELEAAIVTLHETVAGRQALTVFQGDKLAKYPLSSLQSACDLVAAAARLRSPAPTTLAEKPLAGPTR